MANIQLEAIEKKFGEQSVLHPSSLDIKDGEFVVLVGPSGCGKTTFLRLIAGLEEVSSGIIRVNGKDITWEEPKNRKVAMVFQNYALYPHMTVEQNLRYPLNIQKLKELDKQRKVKNTAAILEIDQLLNRKPSELSGGQKQRVAIGRALIREPDIFLFDEPLSNLDARLREQMRLELQILHSKLKRTSIYVTHDQHEAMTLGDRVVVMNQGKIIQVGHPIDLYKDPDALFVAKFLGSPPLNVFKGKRTANQKVKFQFGELPLEIDPNLNEDEFLLGIRPEDFEITSHSNETTLSGQVKFTEQLGRETHLRIAIGDDEIWAISQNDHISQGDTLQLSIKPDKQLWFSVASEKRIRPK